MVNYELVLVLPGNLEKQDLLNLNASLKKILTTLKFKLLKEDDWGIKRMAYPIKRVNLGQYLFWTIGVDQSKIKELSRLLNFETKLLRYMLLKIPAPAEKTK